jgi:quinol monooxygenase YgiN
MSEHAHVIRVARMRPTPGRRAELLARLHKQVDAMRSVTGLFGAQVCEIQEDPESLVLISRWQDEEAMQRAPTADIGKSMQSVAQVVEHEDVQHLVTA